MYAVMPSTPSPRHADGTAQRGGLAVDLASGTQDAGSSTESHASGGAATGSGAVSNEAMRRRQSEKQRLQQNDALRYSTATCSLFVLYGVWDGAATTQVLKYPPLACLCSDPRTLILSASARLLSGCTTYCGPARSMLKDLPKRTMREKLEAVHDAQGKFIFSCTRYFALYYQPYSTVHKIYSIVCKLSSKQILEGEGYASRTPNATSETRTAGGWPRTRRARRSWCPRWWPRSSRLLTSPRP